MTDAAAARRSTLQRWMAKRFPATVAAPLPVVVQPHWRPARRARGAVLYRCRTRASRWPISAPLHRRRRRRRRRRDGAVASCRRAPGGKPLRVTARPRLQAAGVALLSLCTRWILMRETVRGVHPFAQKSRTPTVAKECQIGLYDPAEADLELFCNCWSAGFLGEGGRDNGSVGGGSHPLNGAARVAADGCTEGGLDAGPCLGEMGEGQFCSRLQWQPCCDVGPEEVIQKEGRSCACADCAQWCLSCVHAQTRFSCKKLRV